MYVKCDSSDCRHNKQGECQKNEIELMYLECNDYDLMPEEELYPDIFYTRNSPEKVIKEGCEEWVKTRGKKIVLLGREMFNRAGYISDGRTGALVCYEDNMAKVEENKEAFFEKAEELERTTGISPLYR